MDGPVFSKRSTVFRENVFLLNKECFCVLSITITNQNFFTFSKLFRIKEVLPIKVISISVNYLGQTVTFLLFIYEYVK